MSNSLRLDPVEKRVLAFNASYLAAATGVSVSRGNSEFILYIVVMLVLGAVILVAHRRTSFPPAILWCLSLWGVLHMAGGLVPVPDSWPINGNIRVLYSLWLIPERLKYDQVIHAYGFGLTTVVCWHGLRAIIRGTLQRITLTEQVNLQVRPTFGMLTLCAAAGMGFGALNEVIEFVITLCIPNTNIGGYINTGWDLVSNLAGSVMACLLLRFVLVRPVSAKS